jgi:hypothetical protein
MRTVSAILMTVLLVCFVFTSVWGESDIETQFTAAQSWLSFIDSGNYSESWKTSSTYFRGVVSEESWVGSLDAVRKPLGKLVNREIVETQESNSLPGAPDRRYVVMSFKTVFEKKKSAIETVTFILDNDGKWRSVGYLIK